MLNFAICDDNPNILEKLSHMFDIIFTKHDLDAKVAFKTTQGIELLSYIDSNPIDVFILDIMLESQMSGIEIAKQIRAQNKDCYFIFITAHSEFIFLAFKYKTFDYLCKPVTLERLEETTLRLFEDIEQNTSKKYIKLDNKNCIIPENQIQYIKRDGMKIIFHTNYGDYETYSSFSKLQNQLPNNFIRCHKSFIVNINNINRLDLSSNLIYFDDNKTCDIGPKYKEDLMKGIDIYEKVEK